MQKSLGLKHVDVSNLRKIRILCSLLEDRLCLVGLEGVGLQISCGLAKICCNLQSCHTACLLIYMSLKALSRLDHYAEINGLGERAVIRCNAGHIDNTLLEANDTANRYNGHTIQGMGPSGTNRRCNLTDHAREDLSTGYLYTRLDNILNRCNTGGLTRMSDLKMAADELIVLKYQFLHFFLIYIKNVVLHFCLVCKLDIVDFDLT